MRGERFEEGDEYVQVTKDPVGTAAESNFLLDRRDDLREIRMSCQLTGMYAHWQLTPAQGGTSSNWRWGYRPAGSGIDSSTSQPAASTSGAGRTSRSTAFATRRVGRLLRRAELDGAWDQGQSCHPYIGPLPPLLPRGRLRSPLQRRITRRTALPAIAEAGAAFPRLIEGCIKVSGDDQPRSLVHVLGLEAAPDERRESFAGPCLLPLTRPASSAVRMRSGSSRVSCASFTPAPPRAADRARGDAASPTPTSSGEGRALEV